MEIKLNILFVLASSVPNFETFRIGMIKVLLFYKIFSPSLDHFIHLFDHSPSAIACKEFLLRNI